MGLGWRNDSQRQYMIIPGGAGDPRKPYDRTSPVTFSTELSLKAGEIYYLKPLKSNQQNTVHVDMILYHDHTANVKFTKRVGVPILRPFQTWMTLQRKVGTLIGRA